MTTAAELVSKAERIAVLTGAGISTASGIPDFRGPQGVWTKNPEAEAMFDLDSYVASRAVRVEAWKFRLAAPAWTAEPNAGHLALVELERQGRLTGLITQNVDGLHQKAGSSDEVVIEIHGSLREVVCMSCGERAPMERALERVTAGETDPPCRTCGGILKSATISFGQPLVPEVLAAAKEAVIDCDLLLVVGSSLSVQPAAGLVQVAHDAGVRVVIINASPTPYDSIADAVLRGSVADVLPPLVEAANSTPAAAEGAT